MRPTPWNDFLLRVKRAGFVNSALIASKNAIVNAYAFYVRGRNAGVDKGKLDEFISRWLFGTLLTARYSGSSETVFEQDLARVSQVDSSERFVRALDDALGETITGDYWTHTLVAALETQKARAPSALAFRAAQVVLGTKALFSDQLLQNLLEGPGKGGRAGGEAHHLFPEAWLSARGVRDRRRINQVANLAVIGWHENTSIGARGPADYVARLRRKLALDDDRWGHVCAEHGLPADWESMEYEEFLRQRRLRMADIIRIAFRQLGGESEAPPLTPPWFLPGAESVWQDIVETERALRRLVREVYVDRYGDGAAEALEAAIPARERESLGRALRARPTGAEALSIVDYFYLGQLLPLLFASEVWPVALVRLGGPADARQKLQTAIDQIAPVRNAIAHIREVDRDRLLRPSLACGDVRAMLKTGGTVTTA
jgi:hypothetical protein